jgi:erythromycin esterase-like protein
MRAPPELRRALVPLQGDDRDWDALLERVGDARFVFLGEPTHGTRELYRERIRITKRLLEERGFDAVAVEADWSDAHRVHRFVGGRGDDRTAAAALGDFVRFPSWIWHNAEMVDFVAWLRRFDDGRPERAKVGLYGLDLYGATSSVAAVLAHLRSVDPDAAERAAARYACLEDTNADADASRSASCRAQIAAQLVELRARTTSLAAAGERGSRLEDAFVAEQDGMVVQSWEAYRAAAAPGAAPASHAGGSPRSWNIRSRHMADSLAAIVQHVNRRLGRACRAVVWAHDSHVGDARATEASAFGELTLGQLARERYGRDAFLVGMTTYEGTVTAARAWGAAPEVMTLRPAIAGSFERLLHETGVPRFVVLPGEDGRLPHALRGELFERAIGAVYRPETERQSHWFRARLGDQFDAVVHVDRTSALAGERDPYARTTSTVLACGPLSPSSSA